jgi:hypothetical protein
VFCGGGIPVGATRWVALFCFFIPIPHLGDSPEGEQQKSEQQGKGDPPDRPYILIYPMGISLSGLLMTRILHRF